MLNPNDKQLQDNVKDGSRRKRREENEGIEKERDVKRRSIKEKESNKIILPFPINLHDLIDDAEQNGKGDIISFCPDGKAFIIHKPAEFTRELMPHYFKTRRLDSFQRQLLLYGFKRFVAEGDCKPGYYHDLFVKGEKSLSLNITRKPQRLHRGRVRPKVSECGVSQQGSSSSSLVPTNSTLLAPSLGVPIESQLEVMNRAIRRNEALLNEMKKNSRAKERPVSGRSSRGSNFPSATPIVSNSRITPPSTINPSQRGRLRRSQLDIFVPHQQLQTQQGAFPSVLSAVATSGGMDLVRRQAAALPFAQLLSSGRRRALVGTSPLIPTAFSALGINPTARPSLRQQLEGSSNDLLAVATHHLLYSTTTTTTTTTTPSSSYEQQQHASLAAAAAATTIHTGEHHLPTRSTMLIEAQHQRRLMEHQQEREQRVSSISSLRSKLKEVEDLLSNLEERERQSGGAVL